LSTDVRGEFENALRTAAQPYEIFVGVTFFRLHFLVSKKGSWGVGRSPDLKQQAERKQKAKVKTKAKAKARLRLRLRSRLR
jgi:hypothetical protein